MLRLFIAVELNAAATEELSRCQERLKAALDMPIAWTAPSMMHLTLKFLGDVAGDRVEEILASLESQVSAVESFTVHLGGVRRFSVSRSTKGRLGRRSRGHR